MAIQPRPSLSPRGVCSPCCLRLFKTEWTKLSFTCSGHQRWHLASIHSFMYRRYTCWSLTCSMPHSVLQLTPVGDLPILFWCHNKIWSMHFIFWFEPKWCTCLCKQITASQPLKRHISSRLRKIAASSEGKCTSLKHFLGGDGDFVDNPRSISRRTFASSPDYTSTLE